MKISDENKKKIRKLNEAIKKLNEELDEAVTQEAALRKKIVYTRATLYDLQEEVIDLSHPE